MYLQSKFLQLFFICTIFCIGSCSEDEERLVKTLFTGYNKLIRPARNITEKVHVKFGLGFVQLINVNEREQIMKSNVWLRFEWFDYQLQWDEADYGDIKVLRLPPDKVWKPDIVLFNNADGNYEVRYKSNVLIHPNGEVLWVPPAIYQSSCTIDVTYFPFDEQTCVMKFSSWTFNGDQVSLSLYNNKHFVDLSDYGISGTWDIISVPAFLNVYRTENRPTETDITFHIVIRRKTIFYTVNLILPTVLISLLCVLEFYLPAEARQKITLGISILLSLVVFLLLVSKILPPTSLVVPLIAKYLLFTFIMNVSSILSAVVIINWNFRGPQTHRMPELLRTIFLNYLPKVLLMQRPKRTSVRCIGNLPSSIQPQNRQKPYCAIHNPIKETLEMVEFYQQNYHHDPRANNDYNQPSTSDISRHPHISGIVVQPNTSDVYWPSTSDTYNQPNTFDRYNQPSNTGVYIRPSTSGICRQHSTSTTYNCPSTSDVYIGPSTSDTYNQSSTFDTYNQSSTSDVYNQPSTSGISKQTSISDTYNQPSTSGIVVQPSTSGTSQEYVKAVNSSEEDDSIFSCSKVLRAAKAIEFIAEHVRNEELYLQTREDWKFMAMVINRFQLYLFFIVTTLGTVTLMMHAPHIFEHVDQEKIKQIYYGK